MTKEQEAAEPCLQQSSKFSQLTRHEKNEDVLGNSRTPKFTSHSLFGRNYWMFFYQSKRVNQERERGSGRRRIKKPKIIFSTSPIPGFQYPPISLMMLPTSYQCFQTPLRGHLLQEACRLGLSLSWNLLFIIDIFCLPCGSPSPSKERPSACLLQSLTLGLTRGETQNGYCEWVNETCFSGYQLHRPGSNRSQQRLFCRSSLYQQIARTLPFWKHDPKHFCGDHTEGGLLVRKMFLPNIEHSGALCTQGHLSGAWGRHRCSSVHSSLPLGCGRGLRRTAQPKWWAGALCGITLPSSTGGLPSSSSRPCDFPGGPVVRALHFHCKGHRFDPRSGN